MNEPTLPDAEHWPHASMLIVDDEPGMCHFLQKEIGRAHV